MNIADLQTLEFHSKNIFSNNREERAHARIHLIEKTNSFQNTPKAGQKYPHWLFVSTWVKQFLTEEKFPYEIQKKKAGDMKSYVIKCPKVEKIQEDSLKPGYVVIMPHRASGGTTEQIAHQIDLLKKEGFGITEEESIQEARQRLRIVIGANFCDSLIPSENKIRKKYLKKLSQISSSTTHFMGFS